jgi:diguanylate cyclase (GGDEF)-like protein
VIPSPGAPAPASMRPNDAYFDLLIETLAGLEPGARAQFLQRFFQSLSHVDIPENQTIGLWDEILTRRAQLSERADSLISFQTALVDVLSATGKFRLPVVLEYEELKQLQRTAVTDPLTGLNNRRLFDEIVDKELNRARRYAHSMSLVILDLHQFKEVNDKHGHPRGDEVLHAAAATFRKALRVSDSAFRIGGDEFALVLPQTDLAQASALSKRIGVVFSEMLGPLALSVSVGIDHGVATFPQDGDQREQLVRIADQRLYHFKHAGPEEASAAPPTVVTEAPAEPPPDAESPAVSAPEPEIARGEVSATEAAETVTSAVAVPPIRETVAAPEPAAEAPSPTAAAAPDVVTPEVIPPSAVPTPKPTAPVLISPLQTSQPTFAVEAPETRIYAVPRKAERVSMSGTNAYAVLGDQPSNRARVVDLGFGGVALDVPSKQHIPETLLAVLHVPILPPVRVSLKNVWTRHLSEDTVRVGCCFIS